MKKLSKILLSVAAASAVAATMAISAMAEDTITGEYNKETGVVTFTSDIAPTGVSQTLLVLTDDDGTVLSSEIAQIDQRDHGESFSSFVLPAGLPESAEGSPSSVTYYIKIGGKNGTIQTGTLTIEASVAPVTTITIIIGDVNLNGKLQSNDALFSKRYAAKFDTNIGHIGETYSKTDGTTVIIGDVNLNGKLQSNDALFSKRYAAKFDTNIGHIGTTVEVIEK